MIVFGEEIKMILKIESVRCKDGKNLDEIRFGPIAVFHALLSQGYDWVLSMEYDDDLEDESVKNWVEKEGWVKNLLSYFPKDEVIGFLGMILDSQEDELEEEEVDPKPEVMAETAPSESVSEAPQEF